MARSRPLCLCHLPLSQRFAKIRQTLKSHARTSNRLHPLDYTNFELLSFSLLSVSPLAIVSLPRTMRDSGEGAQLIISIIDELINRSYELSRPKARSLGYRCPASYRLSHLCKRGRVMRGHKRAVSRPQCHEQNKLNNVFRTPVVN